MKSLLLRATIAGTAVSLPIAKPSIIDWLVLLLTGPNGWWIGVVAFLILWIMSNSQTDRDGQDNQRGQRDEEGQDKDR